MFSFCSSDPKAFWSQGLEMDAKDHVGSNAHFRVPPVPPVGRAGRQPLQGVRAVPNPAARAEGAALSAE